MTSARDLLTKADGILLDFDGPVTGLMPAPSNTYAANRARAPLRGLRLPPEVQRTNDHLEVLRWSFKEALPRFGDVERACTAAEVECALTSHPSPEIAGFLALARQRKTPVAVASNNSQEAVTTFLDRFPWGDQIRAYACRTPETARLLKPHPFLVTAACKLLGLPPGACVFVGDSVSDVVAGHAAGVPVIGLAKARAREHELSAAGADAMLIRGHDADLQN